MLLPSQVSWALGWAMPLSGRKLGCKRVPSKACLSPPGIKMSSYEVLPSAVDRKTLLQSEFSNQRPTWGRRGGRTPRYLDFLPHLHSGLQSTSCSLSWSLTADWGPQRDLAWVPGPDRKKGSLCPFLLQRWLLHGPLDLGFCPYLDGCQLPEG